MLRFSPQNAKTKKLTSLSWARKWLKKRKVYSFDLLAGYYCPFALECKSRAIETIEGLRIYDGEHCKFRCFSASQEARLPCVYKLRKENGETIKKYKTIGMISTAILSSIPHDAGIVRIHVSGDFFNRKYFKAWLQVARSRPDVLFYAYTKAIRYWIENLGKIPKNLVLTASCGGIDDKLIGQYRLPSALVVKTKWQARKLGLPVDSNDSHAANPAIARDFALVLHGTQPKGSLWK